MFKHSLAALALATSLAACHDRAPQIIQVPVPAPTDIEHPGQMAVNGQATLELSPDCADISITIAIENAKTGTAVKQLEQKKAALVAALQKIGIEAGQVKLSSMSLDPVYEMTAQGYPTNRVRAYRTQLTVTATTKDFGKVGDIMDAGGSAGATSMSTAFRRSDLAEQKKRVRDMALAAAKAKAEQTASALGIKLGRVLSVVENPGGMMWSQAYFPQVANAVETRDAAVVLGGQLQPLTLDVSITYELPKPKQA
jgi:uncharacterized protein